MATDKDKLIISELLFFINNKLRSTMKDAVVQMCVKFFFEEEITAAMTSLENTLGIRLRKRYNKGEDINVKHVRDLYDKLFSLDASSTLIQFLAADITQVPSAEWEQDNSNSLASPEQLLASIFSLRRIVAQLQSQMVSREFLEMSLSQICSSNRNGVHSVVAMSSSSPQSEDSPEVDSPLLPPPPPPPIAPLNPTAPGASQPSTFAEDAGQPSFAAAASLLAASSSATSSSATSLSATSSSVASSSVASSSAAFSSAASSLAASESTATDSTTPSDSSSVTSLSGSRREEVVDRQREKVGRKPQPVGANGSSGASGGNKRTLNKRDRNSPIVIGKNVSTGLMSLKGADLTVARYIGRLALDTTVEQIRASLVERKVDVVSCEAIPTKRSHPSFSSFKLVVKKLQLQIIENDDFWPDGVIVGRYWSPRAASETATDAAAAATDVQSQT